MDLGDSVTVGYGLRSHAVSYPYVTAERLQRMGGRPIEPSTARSTATAPGRVLWLEREGLRYQPDLVVLGFVLNDVAGSWRRSLGSRRPASKQLVLKRLFRLDRMANWSALRRARAPTALAVASAGTCAPARKAKSCLESGRAGRRPATTGRQRGLQPMTLADLYCSTTLCLTRRKMRLCPWSSFPYAFQVSVTHGADDPQRRLLELGRPALRRLSVARISCRACTLRRAGERACRRRLLSTTRHPTLLGSLVVRIRLADFIVSERLLPDPREVAAAPRRSRRDVHRPGAGSFQPDLSVRVDSFFQIGTVAFSVSIA